MMSTTKIITMVEVRAAKAGVIEARRARSGSSTVDFILSQVREDDATHLAAAISYLKKIGAIVDTNEE